MRDRPTVRCSPAALLDPGYLIETETTSARPYDEVLYDAISALPEATRLTNQPMSQTSSGRWEPDPIRALLCRSTRPEFVTRALAGAAANVGSTAKILSGRPAPGAARVREVPESTVGADERLLQQRTTPVTVDLWVDNILLDVLDHPDIYDDAYDELDRREDEVPAPDNVDATPPPGFEWLDERDEHGLPSVVGRSGEGLGRRKLNAELKDRPLTPGEQAERQALVRIAELREPLDALRRAD